MMANEEDGGDYVGQGNAVARDLWGQVFDRLAASPAAAIVDPNHADEADQARSREALRAAGWSDAMIAATEASKTARVAEAPVTSPGINRAVEAQYAALADDVEGAMARLGYNTQRRVARGVEPRVGPYAAKTNVVMTDESIVSIGTFLFRYCGLVARAFTRTLRLDPFLWESDKYDPAAARRLLAGNRDLQVYWMLIYVSFALTGTHVFVPYRPSTPYEVLLMEQVARAMEMFAIAHEYGHHHLDHGRTLEEDARAEEFAADAFALRIADEAEKRPVLMQNPYMVSGAGGLILLTSLDTLRAVEEVAGARRIDMGTHPSVAERIERFDSIRILFPNEHRLLKGFRIASLRIMAVVHETIASSLASMPEKLIDELRRDRSVFEKWKNIDKSI